MQQADTERPPINPARVGFEVTKCVAGAVSTLIGNSERAHDDADHAGEGPKDSDGLTRVSLGSTQRLVRYAYIQKRQPPIQ
jgi:hypothetical protein